MNRKLEDKILQINVLKLRTKVLNSAEIEELLSEIESIQRMILKMKEVTK